MPVAEFEGKRYDFPEGTSTEQIHNYFRKQTGKAEKPQEEGPLTEDIKGAVGLGETALQMATDFAMMPATGWLGIYESVTQGDISKGADAIEHIRGATTYTPRTEEGQAISSAIGNFVASGINAIGDGAKVVAPQEYELEAEHLAEGGTEALLAVAPFIPAAIRKAKAASPAARRAKVEAGIAEYQKKLLQKKAEGPAKGGLQEQIYRYSCGRRS